MGLERAYWLADMRCGSLGPLTVEFGVSDLRQIV
jgi:hypothetical protein